MPDDDYQPSRVERILVALSATCIALSVLCFLTIVVVTGLLHLPGNGPVWAVVVTLPLIGLPMGFVLFATLVIVNFVRRRRTPGGRAQGTR